MKTGHTLITGVGRRAGLHLARHFVERGRPVIGTYRHEYAALEGLAKSGVELVRCEYEDLDSVASLVARVSGNHAGLRGIVHNVSHWVPDSAGSINTVLNSMMRVHVGVPMEINQGLAPLLLNNANGPADVIHIGDYVSARGSKKHMAYAASKAAQDNLTLSFSQLWAPKVKVNSIAPALLAFNDADGDDYKAKALAKSLMQKEAGFAELLHAVDYLFDSDFVTGRILHLDGGRHLR